MQDPSQRHPLSACLTTTEDRVMCTIHTKRNTQKHKQLLLVQPSASHINNRDSPMGLIDTTVARSSTSNCQLRKSQQVTPFDTLCTGRLCRTAQRTRSLNIASCTCPPTRCQDSQAAPCCSCTSCCCTPHTTGARTPAWTAAMSTSYAAIVSWTAPVHKLCWQLCLPPCHCGPTVQLCFH